MAVNQDRLLQDFSSPVELNRTLSDGFERSMAFPYSQGSRKEAVKPISINKPVYHFSGADVKQRELYNGISHSDALVQNTEMTSNGQTMSYRVEHLASFQHINGNKELLPEDALKKLNEISEDGGLWSQLMIMKVLNTKLIMANGETNETIEEYSLENISLCTYVTDHPAVNNIFIFSTKYSNDKVGAIHLFQCKSSEAAVIASDINRRRGGKDKMIAGEGVVNGGFSDTSSPKVNGHSKVADDGDTGDNVAKKNLENLGYVHDETDNLSSPRHGAGVHQRVEAFQKISEPKPTEILRTGSRTSADYVSKETRQARINRDVIVWQLIEDCIVKAIKQIIFKKEALNRCIETAEDFIVELKKMNDARKKLSVKGPKKSMKRKYEGARSLAKGPSEASTIDMYQKFKYAFNLLGKLKSQINNPNAPELVNYLFVPLEIIVKVLGHETARSVVSPLMTVAAIDLLTNCLRSRDHEFWKSLGPNWCLPQSAPMFHDRYITPYTPKFKDGWTPPEIVADERGAAAAKSTAAMVARMKIVEEEEEKKKKALDEKRAAEEAKHHYETPPVPPVPVVATHVKKTAEETPKRQPVGELKFALVVYDYWAHNNKELTIRAGEKVVIIDDTRRWWLVRNNDDEQGYVPSTVLEVYNPETTSETSSAGSSVSPVASPVNTATVSLNETLEQTKKDQPVSAENTPATVVTARSIITESSQFSNPSSPVSTVPPPMVIVSSDPPEAPSADPEPPTFLPPPPPAIELAAPAPAPAPAVVKVENKATVQKAVETDSLQVELSAKLQKASDGESKLADAADSVDFFIPLFKSSTADDVSRWLKRMKFEPLTVERLTGVAAKELFKKPEDDLITILGEREGKRLYNELQVQTGAVTRHKTMTEFQKALLERMKRQETIQKSVIKHQVVVKSSSGSAEMSQEEMQRKFKEQQELIKAQNSHPEREPEKPSFSSFQATKTVNNNEDAATAVNS